MCPQNNIQKVGADNLHTVLPLPHNLSTVLVFPTPDLPTRNSFLCSIGSSLFSPSYGLSRTPSRKQSSKFTQPIHSQILNLTKVFSFVLFEQ